MSDKTVEEIEIEHLERTSNSSAFPFTTHIFSDGSHKFHPGISQREYFASTALQGMIAGSQGVKMSAPQFASQSVKLADALIKELNKKT